MGVATFLVPAQVNAGMGIPAGISAFGKGICRTAGFLLPVSGQCYYLRTYFGV